MDTKYLEIIKAPLVTEKARSEQQNGKYTFSWQFHHQAWPGQLLVGRMGDGG